MFSIFALKRTPTEIELGRLGCKMFIFDYTLKNANTTTTAQLISRFTARQPDILMFGKDFQLTRDILVKLKGVSPKTKFVMWYGDQRGGVPSEIKERHSLLDMLIINNADPAQFKMYKDFGIPNVATYYDGFYPDQFYPINQARQYDVFFGGTRYPNGQFPLCRLRHEWIMLIRKHFKLLIHGRRWNFKHNKEVKRATYNLAMQKAKITLGMNHFDVVRYYSERVIESLASGRPHLTYYIPEMEKDFTNHKHLVWFKNIDESLELIKYYLEHDEEREKIGKAGRKLMLSKYTFRHKAKNFINALKDVINDDEDRELLFTETK